MSIFTMLTGHTCGDHCWHAKELVCRCSCGGANHGIMLRGGTRPQRTRKIGGNFYELVSIVATDEGQTGCQANAMVKAELELKRVTNERFPGLTWMGCGSWRPEAHKPVLDMAITRYCTGSLAVQGKEAERVSRSGTKLLGKSRIAG